MNERIELVDPELESIRKGSFKFSEKQHLRKQSSHSTPKTQLRYQEAMSSGDTEIDGSSLKKLQVSNSKYSS